MSAAWGFAGLIQKSLPSEPPRRGDAHPLPAPIPSPTFSQVQQSLKGLWESSSTEARDEGGAFYKQGPPRTVGHRKKSREGAKCRDTSRSRLLRSALVDTLAH